MISVMSYFRRECFCFCSVLMLAFLFVKKKKKKKQKDVAKENFAMLKASRRFVAF